MYRESQLYWGQWAGDNKEYRLSNKEMFGNDEFRVVKLFVGLTNFHICIFALHKFTNFYQNY